MNRKKNTVFTIKENPKVTEIIQVTKSFLLRNVIEKLFSYSTFFSLFYFYLN